MGFCTALQLRSDQPVLAQWHHRERAIPPHTAAFFPIRTTSRTFCLARMDSLARDPRHNVPSQRSSPGNTLYVKTPHPQSFSPTLEQHSPFIIDTGPIALINPSLQPALQPFSPSRLKSTYTTPQQSHCTLE